MIDKEKMVKALRHCAHDYGNCNSSSCPFYGSHSTNSRVCRYNLMMAAANMLDDNKLEFYARYENFEVRTCAENLTAGNDTIELVKWNGDHCFVIAFFKREEGGYCLHFVGNRFFDHIPADVRANVMEMLDMAQKALNDYFERSKI